MANRWYEKGLKHFGLGSPTGVEDGGAAGTPVRMLYGRQNEREILELLLLDAA